VAALGADGSVRGTNIFEKAKELLEELRAETPSKSTGLVKDFALGCRPGTYYRQNTYISMYARTKRCCNELGSRTNYVRSCIPHCNLFHVLGCTYALVSLYRGAKVICHPKLTWMCLTAGG
jgi:hypothetical protein